VQCVEERIVHLGYTELVSKEIREFADNIPWQPTEEDWAHDDDEDAIDSVGSMMMILPVRMAVMVSLHNVVCGGTAQVVL